MSAFSKVYKCLKTIVAYLLSLIRISHNNHIVHFFGRDEEKAYSLLASENGDN